MPEPLREQPRTFGHYDVESLLGKGAMGMVYLARDRRIGRKVALKTVHLDETFDDESEANEFYKRLQREAELCGALQHPNIVTLYEPGYENDVIAWLATEYVDGESLRDRMRKKKPLPLPEALRIGEDILRGLVYAHAKGIVHRDIKPANILLTSAGEAKIADFGIARPMDSNLTAVGEMLGTPSYMSPEQVKCSPVTTRSDLFSVGAVLYEMIGGVKAFGAPDVTSILRNVVEAQPKTLNALNRDVPEGVSNVVVRLLAKNPEDRFESASSALEALEKARRGTSLVTLEEVETVGESTLASAGVADNATSPSVTDFGHDDATPAIGSRPTLSIARRPVPPALFFATILLVLGSFAAWALGIRAQTNASPTAYHTPQQIAEFKAKREAINSATRLYQQGDYKGSIAAYDRFIARFGETVRAKEERAEAVLAMNPTSAR